MDRRLSRFRQVGYVKARDLSGDAAGMFSSSVNFTPKYICCQKRETVQNLVEAGGIEIAAWSLVFTYLECPLVHSGYSDTVDGRRLTTGI